MKLRNLIIAIAILALPFAASAATFIIPVAGHATGANGTFWQSDVTIHSTSKATITLALRFRDGSPVAPKTLAINPGTTVTLDNIVKNTFGRTETTGAIEIDVPDADFRRFAVTSRTYNVTAVGELGQDIPATRNEDAAGVDDIVVIPGPAIAAKARFNFGMHVISPTVVKWELVRKDGTIAATKHETYLEGTQRQFNNGAQTLFGVTAADNDTVRASMEGGRAVFYGSIIDQATGDPTFVPATRTRDLILINFLGADLDENGTVDIADADHDGVLDAALEITTSLVPNFFRLVAVGEFGEVVSFELVSAPLNTVLVSQDGSVQAAGPGDLKGTNSQILVRATAGTSSTVLRIPVHYR